MGWLAAQMSLCKTIWQGTVSATVRTRQQYFNHSASVLGDH